MSTKYNVHRIIQKYDDLRSSKSPALNKKSPSKSPSKFDYTGRMQRSRKAKRKSYIVHSCNFWKWRNMKRTIHGRFLCCMYDTLVNHAEIERKHKKIKHPFTLAFWTGRPRDSSLISTVEVMISARVHVNYWTNRNFIGGVKDVLTGN